MALNSPPVIAIIDDYEGFVAPLQAYATLRESLPDAQVRVIGQQPLGEASIAQLIDVEYLVLIRERTRVTADLLARLPALKVTCRQAPSGRASPLTSTPRPARSAASRSSKVPPMATQRPSLPGR
jgi:hypothetical protein